MCDALDARKLAAALAIPRGGTADEDDEDFYGEEEEDEDDGRGGGESKAGAERAGGKGPCGSNSRSGSSRMLHSPSVSVVFSTFSKYTLVIVSSFLPSFWNLQAFSASGGIECHA